MGWYIASVSWGKDSLAMLHMLIEHERPLDEVVFYDTGVEFEAIYVERDRTLPMLRERDIKYTELRPKRPFLYDMLVKPVNHRDGTTSQGYGWCGGPARWGTSRKRDALDRYAKLKDATVYVGIASDELHRLAKETPPWKLSPLATEWSMTEADCLALCYERGHTWEQDGVKLYDVLDRVSCWCCRNKNLKEIEAIKKHLPGYFDRLVALESAIGEPMKRGRKLGGDA